MGIIEMIALYFIFGLGFYLGMWLKHVQANEDYYGDTEIKMQAYVLGFIFGFVLWPIGLIAMVWEAFF
jgi:hypothetical protein